jgi:putative acetyltransferase
MPEPTVTIRPATKADEPAVRELVFGVLAEFGLKPSPSDTDADLWDLQGAYFDRGGCFDVLLSATGAIIGSVGLHPVDQTTVELRKMYLAPAMRGQGLGRLLLEHALREARRLGFSRVTLETASVLKDAVTLYTRYGFQPYEAEHRSARCDQTFMLELLPGDSTR